MADWDPPVLERWKIFPPPPLCVWVKGSGGGAGAGGGAAVLAGALTVWPGASFTPSMAMRTLESSCSGMLPSSEENGLGGFSRHISQLVLPAHTRTHIITLFPLFQADTPAKLLRMNSLLQQ